MQKAYDVRMYDLWIAEETEGGRLTLKEALLEAAHWNSSLAQDFEDEHRLSAARWARSMAKVQREMAVKAA